MTSRALLCSIVCMLLAVPALGDAVSIQSNWINGVQDTHFDGTTLTVSETTNLDVVIVNTDLPSSQAGFVSATVALITTFDSVGFDGVDFYGLFTGGSVSVQFSDGVTNYEIGGPIENLRMAVDFISPTVSTLNAEGLFDALITTNLDLIDADWVVNPSFGPFSAIDGLVIDISEDLSDFDWHAPRAWTGFAQTQFTLFPFTIPEPSAVMLLAVGIALVGRRRKGI